MAVRPKIIAGNWKMYRGIAESATLVTELLDRQGSIPPSVRAIVCPPFTSLAVVGKLLEGSRIELGAQNMSDKDEGAFTGEISWNMLKSAGCRYVIIGHSERRQYYGETNDTVNAKVKKALSNGLLPIMCVGESLEEREKGITDLVVSTQVKAGLAGVARSSMESVIIAYEPVWAIGTGRTATPVQAQEVHRMIRKLISQLFDWATAETVVIQYGGSVKPENARDLLTQPDIDGALVGGASLKAVDFSAILAAAPPRA